MQHRSAMQHRSRPRRVPALALSLVLTAVLCLATAGSAAGAPGPAGDDSAGVVSGFLAGLWSNVAGLFALPGAPGSPGSLFQASNDDGSSTEDDSTDDGDSTNEDDCDTDGSCGFDPGGVGGIMDPNG